MTRQYGIEKDGEKILAKKPLKILAKRERQNLVGARWGLGV